MKLTLAIPIMNQLNDTKPALGLFKYNTNPETEWMVVDNGSTEPVEKFIVDTLQPERINYIRNQQNLGLVKTYQQIYESCETEVLVITHSDVYIYQKDWDRVILKYFEDIPDLGAVGLFGAQGCGPMGERVQDIPHYGVPAGFSNMIEAELHGFRLDKPWRPAAIFDGFFMAFRMEMLKKVGGFDQRYMFHHLYDRDVCLESIRAGYKNIVVDIPSHHMSGLTANRGEYQEWINNQTSGIRGDVESGDKFTHDHNSELFAQKWHGCLPLYIEDDFTFREATSQMTVNAVYQFVGDKILTHEPPPKS